MTIQDISDFEGYPYIAIGIYESAYAGKPVWVAGNSFNRISDGRTFLKKGKIGKRGRFLKKDYDEFLVAGNTLYELTFDGFNFKYEEVSNFIPAGEYRERFLGG